MTPTITAAETELTTELVDRVMKLSRESLGSLLGLALDHLDGPPDDPEAVKSAWRAELTRRWHAIQSGANPTYTPEEAISYARQRLHERKPQ